MSLWSSPTCNETAPLASMGQLVGGPAASGMNPSVWRLPLALLISPLIREPDGESLYNRPGSGRSSARALVDRSYMPDATWTRRCPTS
jgi:hypothetical protein